MTHEELADRETIRQLLYRYARGVDRLDETLLRSVFWDDAEFEGGPNTGPASAFIPAMFGAGGRVRTCYEVTVHYLLNMLIDWRGDHAFSETYAIAYHRLPPDRQAMETILGAAKLSELGEDLTRSHEFVLGLRYLHRLEKRGSEWRIARKKLAIDWSRVEPYGGIAEGGVYAYLKLRGRRGERADESYRWLA